LNYYQAEYSITNLPPAYKIPPPVTVGGQARVTCTGGSNKLRGLPVIEWFQIGSIPPCGEFTISGGPFYADGYRWWQVNYQGLVGWTAEGDGSQAWIEALTTTNPSTSATLTNTPPPTPSPAMVVRTNRPASLDTARQYTSIWSGLTFVNLEEPGIQTYSKTIDGQPYRWAFSWCGRDANHLQEILRPFSIDFFINDVRVDPTALLQSDTNGNCRNWITVLDGWSSSGQITLDVRYHLSEAIMGGTGIRNPGDYIQRIYVTIR
jgi:hypothetical protein